MATKHPLTFMLVQSVVPVSVLGSRLSLTISEEYHWLPVAVAVSYLTSSLSTAIFWENGQQWRKNPSSLPRHINLPHSVQALFIKQLFPYNHCPHLHILNMVALNTRSENQFYSIKSVHVKYFYASNLIPWNCCNVILSVALNYFCG